jgi:RNA polymerase sigma-70 factor (ECF subfamily)
MTEVPRTADTALARRLKQGDMDAYEELYRLHSRRLYNLTWRMLGNASDAEDALQEVFLQVFRKIGSFKGESALGTWIYRLAMNLCVDRTRSRAAHDDQKTDALDPARMAEPGTLVPEMTMSRLDLERAIAVLPEGCRAAFLLHDVEGFEHREVATILGIAEGTSKSQVHKARLRIRHFLTEPSVAPRAAAGPHLVEKQA